MTRCQCRTGKGTQCSRNVKDNSPYCYQHQNCKDPITGGVPVSALAPPAAAPAARAKKVSAPKVSATKVTKPAPAPRVTKPAPKPSVAKTTATKKDGCVAQTTKKYKERPSPPYPANECCGQIFQGNDGNMYESVPNAKGICRWVKVKGEKARAPAVAVESESVEEFALRQLPVIEATILQMQNPKEIKALCATNREVAAACRDSPKIQAWIKELENRHWVDRLITVFPEWFHVAYYPETRPFQKGEERPDMDKIGGTMPFLRKGEEWPRMSWSDAPYQFAFQLTLPDTPAARQENLPGRGKTVRVFVNPEMEEEDLHVTIIDYSEPHEAKPKVPAGYRTYEDKPFPAYRVLGWREGREIDGDLVEIWEDEEYDPDVHEQILLDLGVPAQAARGGSYLVDPTQNPPPEVKMGRKPGIKYGGVPESWQGQSTYYREGGYRLQMDEDLPAWPWMWGDSGMVHINPDTLDFEGDMG